MYLSVMPNFLDSKDLVRYLFGGIEQLKEHGDEGLNGHLSGRVLVQVVGESVELAFLEYDTRLLVHHLQRGGPRGVYPPPDNTIINRL